MRKELSNKKESTLTNTRIRRLTPKECERLQGFPDDWTSGQTDGQRYKQMGNAVAVPVVEWILRRLVK
jgi:DNA (cytosine-5)-methyltransferase 1